MKSKNSVITIPSPISIVEKAKTTRIYEDYKIYFMPKFNKIWNDIKNTSNQSSVDELEVLKEMTIDACFGANYYNDNGNTYKKQRAKKEEFENMCQEQIKDIDKILGVLKKLNRFEKYDFLNSHSLYSIKKEIESRLINYEDELKQVRIRNKKTLDKADYIDANRIVGNLYYPKDIHKKHHKIYPSTCLAFHLAIIFRLWTSGRLKQDLTLMKMPKSGRPLNSIIAEILDIAFIKSEIYKNLPREYTDQSVKDALGKLDRIKLIPWLEYN